MTTTTLTITDFLLARIAEDEQDAIDAMNTSAIQGESVSLLTTLVLRDCQAKRRIVERHAPTEFFDAPGEYACVVTPNVGFWPCADLLDLAFVYAAHPDYDESWRP